MTPESRKMIHDIMDSESMGYAYVYPLDGSPRQGYLKKSLLRMCWIAWW